MDLPAQTTVYLKDYTPPPFLIPEVDLDIDLLGEDNARVEAKLVVRRNRQAADPTAALRLDLDEITVESVAVDGTTLGPRSLQARRAPPDPAERARRLQPDDRQPHPPQAEHQADGDLHVQHRLLQPVRGRGLPPHHALPGPARRDGPLHGDAACRQGALSGAAGQRQPRRAGRGRRRPALGQVGRPVSQALATCSRSWPPGWTAARTASAPARAERCKLQFFVEPGKLDQGVFALESLKHAMKWDEDTYGLEIDLDQYNVVAVGDFNAGAMENKGLNIFNTKLVLARPDISTDWDFNFIDRTVAHEYFHNWTGNRVTCRDWFQLALKEGPDGLSRAAVRGRPLLARRGAHPGGAQPAHRAVSRGRRADGAPGAAAVVPADQQLLHVHRLPARARKWCA